MPTFAANQPLPALVVLIGHEPLLVFEAADKLRERARQEGFTDQHRFVMDSRSDWQTVFGVGASGSLFGERQMVEIFLPGGKPGKSGAQAMETIANQCAGQLANDVFTVIKLTGMDRSARETRWAKTLLAAAAVIDLPDVGRAALPKWIAQRLAQQNQHMNNEALQWLSDRVEGNLLAAHQEIQKLALLHPSGEVTLEQCQAAVLNVARYDVFALRDAMLDGDSSRMLRVLWGLKAEGEAPPLVLWAISEDIRTLDRISQSVARGQPLNAALKAQRLFGQREQRARAAYGRVSPARWRRAVAHAHDIDRIIKGLPVPGRLSDAWHEMARLGMSIAASRSG
ncbi:DNA polymerase III subunit delta [Orrella daihaiensis]|uniref:DNA polymerase III subunit delta n=1 Tax=Orrella daihaiensis TaxID=2782176 RepID=UPI001FB2B620|nr:DNA polymerase III subunit delta [Orrella daihaiensis]